MMTDIVERMKWDAYESHNPAYMRQIAKALEETYGAQQEAAQMRIDALLIEQGERNERNTQRRTNKA